MNNRTRVASLVCVFIGAAAALALPRPPLPPLPESQRLNVWGFDGTNWLSHPDAAPLAFDNVSLVESWSGYAARLAGSQPALLAWPEQTPSGKMNLSMTGPGTVRFWFAPEWSSAGIGTGPGAEARLLEVGAWSAQGAQGWWSLSINPAGTELRFLAHGNEATVEILRASIDWCAGEWHQVALAWSQQDKTILYVDGQRVAEAAGVALEPLTQFAGVAGFCLGSDVQRGSLAEGQFEQLCTFGRVCTDQELARDFQFNAWQAALGPITPQEEQAWSSSIAQSSTLQLETMGSQAEMGAANYGCALWLEIKPTNSTVLLKLHNTIPGTNYQILSKTNVAATSWTVETNITGASGPDTEVIIPMLGRSNLFLIASETRDYVTNVNFAGLSFLDTETDPADPMGAVGPNHFIELLNGKIAVFDKTTGTNIAETLMTNFFFVSANGTNYPTNRMYDPRILYDHEAQRWLACAIDSGSKYVILAVSTNASPTNLISHWKKYVIPVARPDVVTDFDTLGVDANGVYISVLHQTSTNYGHDVVAIKKPEIYHWGTNINGEVTNLIYTIINVPTSELITWAIQPAVNFDAIPTNGPAWFLAKGPPQLGTNYRGGAIQYRRLQWNGTNVSWMDTNWCVLSESNSGYRNYYDFDGTNVLLRTDLTDLPISAPQKGGTNRINLSYSGSRLQMAVIRDGFLYTCHHVGLDGTNSAYNGGELGTNVDRSAVQWFKLQINSVNDPLTCLTCERIYDNSPTNAHYYYFASLMVNCAQDVVLGFSGSSATNFISAFYTWRSAGGPVPGVPRFVKEGEAHYDLEPQFYLEIWGDYSYTTLDPSGALDIWTVQEYAETPGNQESRWGTWITKLKFQR